MTPRPQCDGQSECRDSYDEAGEHTQSGGEPCHRDADYECSNPECMQVFCNFCVTLDKQANAFCPTCEAEANWIEPEEAI